jgi:hypothetical protein
MSLLLRTDDRKQQQHAQLGMSLRISRKSDVGSVPEGEEAGSEQEGSMSKDWYIEAHEREVADYMDRHPNATWEQAYNCTADRAYDRMRDEMADAADMVRLRRKEAGL